MSRTPTVCLNRQHLRFTRRARSVSAPRSYASASGLPSRHWRRRWEICQERINSTKNGSITSVQAIYVTADDIPIRRGHGLCALDATRVLSRAITELGIYPPVDPLASSYANSRRAVIGDRHYKVEPMCSHSPASRSSKDIIGFSVWMSGRRKTSRRRPRRADSALHVPAPFAVAEQFTGTRAVLSWKRRSRRSRRLVAGEFDQYPEQAFFMQGAIDGVAETAQRLLNA